MTIHHNMTFMTVLLAGIAVLSTNSVVAQAQSCVPQQCGQYQIIIVTGVVSYWPKRDRLIEKIEQCHGDVTVLRPGQAFHKARQIAARAQTNCGFNPVRIVGYSLGADAAIDLAKDLGKYGVTVDRLILVEATYKKNKVPANVCFCYNLYEKRGFTDRFPAFRGVPVCAESPRTCLINQELKDTGLPTRPLNHFNMASKEGPQLLIYHALFDCLNNGCCTR